MPILSRLKSWLPRFSFLKGRSAYWRLALLFVLFPVVELLGMWVFSLLFGNLTMLCCFIVTGLLGAVLAMFQMTRYWAECQRQIQRGEIPTHPASHGILVLIASALLITPGFISDLIGMLLLLPPIRSIVIDYIQRRCNDSPSTNHPPEAPDVIDIK